MATGINLEYLDTDVKPGEDFYQYVNGGWMKRTEIPADRSTWGSFHELAKKTDEKNIELLGGVTDELHSNKAAILYDTGMDVKEIEKQNINAVRKTLRQIEKISDSKEYGNIIGALIQQGPGSIVQFSVHPDLGNSHVYAAYLEPGHQGLPDRDFYLAQDERAVEIREHYLRYIFRILHSELDYAQDQAEAMAGEILNLETSLATHTLSKEDRRQMDKLYNPRSTEEIKVLCPHFNWDAFFQSMQATPPSRMIVTEPEYFKFLNDFIAQTPVEILKTYLAFMTIHHVAPYAHAALENIHFEIFHKMLEGVEQMKPRKERIVRVVNQSLGDDLGKLFVSKYFPDAAKATAKEMVQDIILAFKNRIMGLSWMSENTKAYAIEKLASLNVKIGFPDVWKEYESLDIQAPASGGQYLENLLAISQWNFKKDITRIDMPVDREEWFMAPQVVNAYYNPMFNEIVFPAAILQPPFFDWHADAAVNYGGIGAVIGHEITHGFDDQGSRFDKEGNLNEWWNSEDRTRFESLTNKLIEQFDSYRPFDDLALNGTFTLGENIADLGGLSVAYDALQLYYQRHGHPELIDGFSTDQRFYMSWATVWRTKTRPEALRHQIKTDPHPPGLYRAVAAPSNLDSFYHAFNIQPQSPWYRKQDERIKIW